MEPAEITKVFPQGLTLSAGFDRHFTMTLNEVCSISHLAWCHTTQVLHVGSSNS